MPRRDPNLAYDRMMLARELFRAKGRCRHLERIGIAASNAFVAHWNTKWDDFNNGQQENERLHAVKEKLMRELDDLLDVIMDIQLRLGHANRNI